MLEFEKQHAEVLVAVLREHQASARNLLHYLAMRKRDLRPVQAQLASVGLSSIARAEAHALSSVDAVLEVIDRLSYQHRSTVADRIPCDLNSGTDLLEAHSVKLLGAAPHYRADKGINLPDSNLKLPALTPKDIEDTEFVVRHADMVGLSFANHESDVRALIQRLQALDAADPPGIVLKIETRRGFKRLPSGNVGEQGTPSRAEITDAAMGHRAECVMLNKGPHITRRCEYSTTFSSAWMRTSRKSAPCSGH
jgi:hypothetical protein